MKVMKPKFILIFVLLFLPTFIIWAEGNENKSNENKSSDKQQTKESAEVKNLEFFDAINISALGTLHLKQSNEPNFTIEADKKVLPLITVYVKSKTLFIDMKDASENARAKIDYYLNIKDIKKINSSGSGNFIMNNFKTKELQLIISNLGEANLNDVTIQKLSIQVDGGGKIKAEGMAEQQIVEIKGAGEFDGKKLSGKQGEFTINGSGIMVTNVSDTLNITIPGEGTVKYCAHPNITKNVSEKAIVNPASECPG